MPFAPFHELFPDVAVKETRSATVAESDELPAASYGFLELFCTEEGCDCRRAFIQVVSAGRGQGTSEPLATISFGWEGESFYQSWASLPLSTDDLHELKGPALVRLAQQSQYAPVLLGLFETLIEDHAYVARIIRHYEMYRKAIEKAKAATPVVRSGARSGRNDPCPCGSGQKYKRCCSGKMEAVNDAISQGA